MLKNGVATAIIGAPNAGKSSLLNALVGFDRAIVTDIAGTTRDTVEEKATVGGVLLRLIDTAGLHETDDLVEQLGVERSKKAVEDADLILALLDGSTGLAGIRGAGSRNACSAGTCREKRQAVAAAADKIRPRPWDGRCPR